MSDGLFPRKDHIASLKCGERMEIGGAQGGGSAPPSRVTRAPREEKRPGNDWGTRPRNFYAAVPGRRIGTAAFATDPREEEGPGV